MISDNEELTPAEREALNRLPRDAPARRSLEESTVSELYALGLLRTRERRRTWRDMFFQGHRLRTRLLQTTLAAVLFLAGYALGTRPAEVVRGQQARFMLLLYEDASYRAPAAGQERARVREYASWAADRARSGQLESGEKLSGSSERVVGPKPGVIDESVRVGDERLAGFFVIRAPDEAGAESIAESSPHVRYGGWIVIRRIEET